MTASSGDCGVACGSYDRRADGDDGTTEPQQAPRQHSTAAAQVAAWWCWPQEHDKLIGDSTRFTEAKCGDRRAARWPRRPMLEPAV